MNHVTACRKFQLAVAALLLTTIVAGCCSYAPGAKTLVRGVVVDETGLAVAGVGIEVVPLLSGDVYEIVPNEPADSPQTDQDGRFEAGLPFSPECLTAARGTFAPVPADQIEIRLFADDCTRTVVLTIGEDVELQGGELVIPEPIEMGPCAAPSNP